MEIRLLQSYVVLEQAYAVKLSSRYIFKYKKHSFLRILAMKNGAIVNKSAATRPSDS